MRILLWVNLVRWLVIAALFVSAFTVDATCDAPPGDHDQCTEILLVIGTALLAVTAGTELFGHSQVRRNMRGVMDDPPEPAPPIPLRPVPDPEEDGEPDGER